MATTWSIGGRRSRCRHTGQADRGWDLRPLHRTGDAQDDRGAIVDVYRVPGIIA